MFGCDTQCNRVPIAALLKRGHPVCPERGEIEIGWPLEVLAGKLSISDTRNAIDAHLAAGLSSGRHQVPDACLCHQAVRRDRGLVDGVILNELVGQAREASA